ELQETRFEETENLQARMAPARRRGARGRERIVEQGGVFAGRSREVSSRRLAPFVHELRQLLKALTVAGRVLRSCNDCGERGAMLNKAVAQRSGGAKGAQGRERARHIACKRFRRPPVGLADAP